jgi:hypothetical protein
MPYIHELKNLDELDLLPISPKTHIVYISKPRTPFMYQEIFIRVSNTSRRDSFIIKSSLVDLNFDFNKAEKLLSDKGFKIIHTVISLHEDTAQKME